MSGSWQSYQPKYASFAVVSRAVARMGGIPVWVKLPPKVKALALECVLAQEAKNLKRLRSLTTRLALLGWDARARTLSPALANRRWVLYYRQHTLRRVVAAYQRALERWQGVRPPPHHEEAPIAPIARARLAKRAKLAVDRKLPSC